MFKALLALTLAASAAALYGPRSDVKVLKDMKEITKSDGVAIVEFFAPWCGHCKSLAPEYEKAATALKGIATVAAVDATEQQALASKYGIQGFPTMKVFGANKRSPTDYQGPRTADGIVAAVLKEVKAVANKRLGKKGSSSGGSGSGSRRTADSNAPGGGRNVVTLTDDNFEDLVMNSDDLWLVEFYAPWCGHCKNLAPEWAEAADMLQGDVKVAALDATVHERTAAQFGIQGFPTIKYFPPRSSSPSDAQDYQGPRDASAIASFAQDKLRESGAGSEVVELVDQGTFDDKCSGKRICVIAFLPDLLDSGASGRQEYIDLLTAVAAKRANPILRFMWTASGKQPQMEEAMRLQFGFPAVVAVNKEKSVFSVHKGAFSEEDVAKFAGKIMRGRAATTPLPKFPKVTTVDPWDGSDAEMPEEEFSLEDIMGDEIQAKYWDRLQYLTDAL